MIRDENIRMIFGLKVKMKRQELKMSLSELAKKAEISVSYLNEIEKGKKYPKRSKIASLANTLGTSYDQLVSLKISKKLNALSDLLMSDILHELPLDVFGLAPRNLLELMSDAPAKLSAFVNTIVEISRNYALTVESLYFSVLRSYQEMYDNYFEDIERIADEFRVQWKIDGGKSGEVFRTYLKQIGYTIDEETLGTDPRLNYFRSILKEDGDNKILLINRTLNERQKCFILSREVGYHLMELKERSATYTWKKVNSFDELLNDYKATYFAGALMLPEKELVEEMEDFLNQNSFSAEKLIDSIDSKHQASPETYLHRLTSILPKNFGLNKLFFLRLDHKIGTNKFTLTKELHLDGLHSPHGTVLSEHYCRKWVSLKIFQQLEEELSQLDNQNKIVCSAQVSKYITSGKEYFCISIARPLSSPSPSGNTHTSLTIGFLMDDDFKSKCTFWQSEKIRVEWVNETCERCPATDCSLRAYEPTVLIKDKAEATVTEALEELLNS